MASNANWISVGDLADGFAPDSHILPPCFDLAGLAIKLAFEDGTAYTLAIEQNGTEQVINDPQKGALPVRVTSLRQGYYFIDYLDHQKSVTLLLDQPSGRVLRIIGTLPNTEGCSQSLLSRAQSGLPLTSVEAEFQLGHIVGKTEALGFERTTELIGKRVRYRYSTTELYEHIYLNESFYTWHCISGVEVGLADTDLCHYFKLGPQLYLFVWQEKIVPTLGVVMVDLQQNKTNGKIFGYAGFNTGHYANFPVGALARLANETPPPDMAPW